MEALTLFDQVARSGLDDRLYSETEFRYLNRSPRREAERVRTALEEWFFRYPPLDQADLRGRFRSYDDFNHRSAFFELFLHELLMRLGCRAEIHPSLGGANTRHPDFLVRTPDGERFYLEAVLAGEAREHMAANARMNAVYDIIDQTDSPGFIIGMNLKGAPRTQPRARLIKAFLTEQLSKLDHTQMLKLVQERGLDALPRWHYEYDGWKIEFFAIPENSPVESETHPLGIFIHEARAITPHAIKDRVISKAKRYGDLGLPYVIAVDVLRMATDVTVMDALFGTRQWNFSKDMEYVGTTHLPDGAFAHRTCTRTSAVLVIRHLSPWGVPRAKIRLYHNPWAKRPYESQLNRLPQFVRRGDRMREEDGESLCTIFSLPMEWPED